MPVQPPQPIAITLFGAGGSGKSSLTLSLVRSTFTSSYDPTIEDSYSVTRRVDGVEYVITLTDTAGQEEYRGLWAQEALMADGFVLVYDITNRGSLEQLDWFEGLVRVEGECREERAEAARRGTSPAQTAAARGSRTGSATTPQRSRSGTNATQTSRSRPVALRPVKIVAGNKVDLANSRQVPAREGLEWARRHGCGFMETSARERVNVEETFGLIVRRVVEARREEEQRVLEEEYAREAAEGGRGEDWNARRARRATVDWSEESLRHRREQAMAERQERGTQRGTRRPRRRSDAEPAVGLRHAATAPLSPLEVQGVEKRMRLPLPTGEIGPPRKAGWSWLRCW